MNFEWLDLVYSTFTIEFVHLVLKLGLKSHLMVLII